MEFICPSLKSPPQPPNIGRGEDMFIFDNNNNEDLDIDRFNV